MEEDNVSVRYTSIKMRRLTEHLRGKQKVKRQGPRETGAGGGVVRDVSSSSGASGKRVRERGRTCRGVGVSVQGG